VPSESSDTPFLQFACLAAMDIFARLAHTHNYLYALKPGQDSCYLWIWHLPFDHGQERARPLAFPYSTTLA